MEDLDFIFNLIFFFSHLYPLLLTFRGFRLRTLLVIPSVTPTQDHLFPSLVWWVPYFPVTLTENLTQSTLLNSSLHCITENETSQVRSTSRLFSDLLSYFRLSNKSSSNVIRSVPPMYDPNRITFTSTTLHQFKTYIKHPPRFY